MFTITKSVKKEGEKRKVKKEDKKKSPLDQDTSILRKELLETLETIAGNSGEHSFRAKDVGSRSVFIFGDLSVYKKDEKALWVHNNFPQSESAKARSLELHFENPSRSVVKK